MTQTMDPTFRAALRHELVALTAVRPPLLRRQRTAVVAVLAGALTLGGAVAVAELRPVAEVADPPLAAPLVLNGVGPATVPLPAAPTAARYINLELACFNGVRCATVGGSVEGPDGTVKVERDQLPVTNRRDPSNPQRLSPVDPATGVSVQVAPGTHWRLYAVYSATRDPRTAELTDGRTLGVPGVSPTDLVPALSTDGKAGWIDYRRLTYQAHPRLTSDGTAQDPLPVYADDGTTVLGHADVSQPLR